MLEHVNGSTRKSTGCRITDDAMAVIARANAYHNLTKEARKLTNELSALVARKQRFNGSNGGGRVRQRVAKLTNELRVVDMLDVLRNIVLNIGDGQKFSYPMNNGQFALCIDGVSRGAFFTMQSLADDTLPDQFIDGIPPRTYFSEFTAGLDPSLLGTKPFPWPITKAVRWIHSNGGIDALVAPSEDTVH